MRDVDCTYRTSDYVIRDFKLIYRQINAPTDGQANKWTQTDRLSCKYEPIITHPCRKLPKNEPKIYKIIKRRFFTKFDFVLKKFNLWKFPDIILFTYQENLIYISRTFLN